ncbi:MAG TPA: hypothetical protein VEW42_04470 [Candidatus Eisenbacteria bacterium]|nr:hypothetical protein [Candidatus Eisenbacteria bacterium]
MTTKKRYFTRNKEKVYHSKQDRTSIGNKSVNTREKNAQKVVEKTKPDKVEKRISLKAPQLPNISQIITEGLNKITKRPIGKFTVGRSGLFLFFIIIGGVSLWQGYFLFQKTNELQVVVSKRNLLQEDLGLWQGIAQKYPTYRDAYFQASVLAYRLGNTQLEQTLLAKTLQLDPNYLPAQNLEKITR